MSGKTVTRADIVEALAREILAREPVSGAAVSGAAVSRDALAQYPQRSRQDCVDLLEDVLDLIVTRLSEGETVKLARFGIFSVRAKRARVGRNPKTGVEAEITARRVVTFKPSNILRDRVAAARSAT